MSDTYWSQYSPATPRTVESADDMPPPPAAVPEDPYRKAALEERARLIKAGVPLNEGYTDRAARGAGFGWADEVSAFGQIPLEMIRRGVNPIEAYKYNKAFKQVQNEAIDENTKGVLGGLAEITGGLSSIGAGVAGGAQATAKTIPYFNIPVSAGVVNYGKNIAQGAAMGGFQGFGEGEGLADSATKAAVYAPIGGAVAAALPAVTNTIGQAARVLQMPRLRDPEKVAVEQVNKALRDSGQTMAEVQLKVANAHAAGQTDYTLADAIGKEGHRKLAVINKVPGEARDRITEFMTTRDLNMPTRVQDEFGRALGVGSSAKQATTQLIDDAERAAAPLYRQAERKGPIWNNTIQEILDDPVARAGLREGVEIQRIRAAGTGTPFNPTDASITGFNAAGDPIISGVPNMKTLHTLKVGLDKLIDAETDQITGKMTNRGAAIVGMKNRLLDQIDAINPDYAAARQAFRGPMEIKDAVQTGRDMARTGRYVDNLDTFRALTPAEQQGARIGYADKMLEPLERSGNFPAQMREKALKGSNELEALSLYQGPRQPNQPDQLRQFLNREETMRKGSNAALGGSTSFENFADQAAGPGGMEVMGLASAALGGSPVHAATGIMDILKRVGKGESAAQRDAIAKALMLSNPDEVARLGQRLDIFDLQRRGVNPWVPGRPPRINP